MFSYPSSSHVHRSQPFFSSNFFDDEAPSNFFFPSRLASPSFRKRNERFFPSHESLLESFFRRHNSLPDLRQQQSQRNISRSKDEEEDSSTSPSPQSRGSFSPASSSMSSRGPRQIPIHFIQRPTATNERKFQREPADEDEEQGTAPSRYATDANTQQTQEGYEADDEITAEEWSLIEAMQSQEEKQRMLERFRTYGVKERPVEGDGNCQFSSLSDQLFRTPEHHKKVRAMIAEWLWHKKDYPVAPGTVLKDFLETDCYPTWNDYCKHVAQDRAWGDHITLLAAAELFQRKIIILSSIEISNPKTDPLTIITPKKVTNPPLFLCHWHERHYGSLEIQDTL